MYVCEPDKVAFVDENTPTKVWAVELSDERSKEQFVTFYRTEKPNCPKGDSHRPYIFHRDRGKVAKDALLRQIAGRRWAKQRWKTHYHVLLKEPPKMADLEGHDVPDTIRHEIQEWMSNGRMLSKDVAEYGKLSGAGDA